MQTSPYLIRWLLIMMVISVIWSWYLYHWLCPLRRIWKALNRWYLPRFVMYGAPIKSSVIVLLFYKPCPRSVHFLGNCTTYSLYSLWYVMSHCPKLYHLVSWLIHVLYPNCITLHRWRQTLQYRNCCTHCQSPFIMCTLQNNVNCSLTHFVSMEVNAVNVWVVNISKLTF